ncbi:MAG: substrate-binding domain-containing protein [Spirochaetales bacterium]|nr:substrate-binding domain-containing protein [Spirochaetales bacterium]
MERCGSLGEGSPISRGRVLVVVFTLLFVVALAQSARTMISLSRAVSSRSTDATPRGRHIAVFMPDGASLFFDRIRGGVETAATRYDVAVSFHPIYPDSPEFSFARYSGVDGAIIYPYLDDTEARGGLTAIDDAGIPIVLIERGIAAETPWTFVGTNNFDMGRRIGELVGDLSAEATRVAVVYSDKSPAIAAEKELVELGITSALTDRLASPVIRKQTGLNPLDAEELTYRIVRDEPEVRVLVFTDTNDTLAALQVIIDLNLVGSVQVVGFGVTETILDYLERGVLAATIAVNPRRIGVEAVRALTELLDEGHSPGYIDTGVEVIRSERW